MLELCFPSFEYFLLFAQESSLGLRVFKLLFNLAPFYQRLQWVLSKLIKRLPSESIVILFVQFLDLSLAVFLLLLGQLIDYGEIESELGCFPWLELVQFEFEDGSFTNLYFLCQFISPSFDYLYPFCHEYCFAVQFF